MVRRKGKLQKAKNISKSVESAKKKTRQTRKQCVKYRRQLQNSLDSFTLDQGLKPFCTERQLELLTAWEAYGSKRAAAKALKINPKNFNQTKDAVERKAARQGYSPEHDLNHPTPDGYRLQGASTLYGAHGEQKLQWIKSAYDSELPRPRAFSGRQHTAARRRRDRTPGRLPSRTPVVPRRADSP